MGVSMKWGVPKKYLIFDHFSIETHGDLGIPHFKKPPYLSISIDYRSNDMAMSHNPSTLGNVKIVDFYGC